MKTQNKQYRKIIHLTFSPENSGLPVMCHLVRQFDVTFNIVAAQTMLGKEGWMTVELWGDEARCLPALQYLRDQNIIVVPARQHVSRNEESCMHCGICMAVCPEKALTMDRSTRLVLFDEEECTACGMCTRICPAKAMQANIATIGLQVEATA